MSNAMNADSSAERTLSVAGSLQEPLLYSNIVDLPIAEILPAASPPRTGGADASHIRMLAESETKFPPIVIHRETMRVVDGWHRLHAAQLRGQTTIAAVLFDGGLAEAFVLAVKLNTAHGLPLSLAERKAAALRILSLYPQWSDRAIAATAGISHKTVGALRSRSTGENSQSTGRIARNGVLHRAAGREGRQRAAELFGVDPNAPARKVASAAGISVTTAKDVRKRLRAGEPPMSSRGSAAGSSSTPGSVREPAANVRRPASQRIDAAEMLQRLRKDPSLRFTETGRTLLRWLETPFGDGADWDTIVRSLPNHCTHSLAELARQRALEWQRLACLLDQRS
ncbi:ParB/RepB/Spo0J family partition protein [Nocardia brasiliensis]|uniref:ParB/RepB/Spo0J family partition protein n=1 Tax=Nocardia brasiliensis TaxID=37326 RepID=UPI00366FD337